MRESCTDPPGWDRAPLSLVPTASLREDAQRIPLLSERTVVMAPRLDRFNGPQRTATWRIALVWLLLCALCGAGGCKRVKDERKLSAATLQAIAAIQQYSAASDAANSAHRAVMTAFADANRSSNLPDYKQSLRTVVLPAMDAFIARLDAMPAGTPGLAAVHRKLVLSYKTARTDIDAFESGLEDVAGLGGFDDIRQRLQAGVANYSKELERYYARFDRRLRLEGAPGPMSSVAQASAATGTSAP